MKRPFLLILFALLPSVLMLGGCSLAEFLNRPVSTAAAEDQVAALRQALADLKAYTGTLEHQLGEAKEIADKSQSEAAIAAVGKLQAVLEAAKARIPEVERMISVGEAAVAELKEAGPTVPLWGVLVSLALPLVAPAAAAIPGVGPVVAPILGKIANGAWDAYATKLQKDQEAEVQAKAAALAHQVEVTRKLIAVVPDDVKEPILRLAKDEQRAAGVHLTLRRLIDAEEARIKSESKAA